MLATAYRLKCTPEPLTAIDPGQLNQTMVKPNYNEQNTSYSA